jgi:hypothetical protein
VHIQEKKAAGATARSQVAMAEETLEAEAVARVHYQEEMAVKTAGEATTEVAARVPRPVETEA